jgi:hypothetical protein
VPVKKAARFEAVSLPDGDLYPPYSSKICSEGSCKAKAVVQIRCGGGYEYEPAELCLEHYGQTATIMFRHYEQLREQAP